MPAFKFNHYSIEELEQCGIVFKEAWADLYGDKGSVKAGPCTDFVINFFADCCADQRQVNSKCHGGEFMYDLCYTNAIRQKDHNRWFDWKETIEQIHYSILLALESEWGKQNNKKGNYVEILDDASKLAFSRAKTKVMIFASQKSRDYGKIIGLLQQLRQSTHDTAPWLCIDCPWGGGGKVQFQLLAD